MIHLICTFEPRRISFLPQFVEHYSLLGVEAFHLSVQLEPNLSPVAREAAKSASSAVLAPYNILLASALVQPFNSHNLRIHHDAIAAAECAMDDWIVWADVDEFQVYPGEFKSLLRFAESLKTRLFLWTLGGTSGGGR